MLTLLTPLYVLERDKVGRDLDAVCEVADLVGASSWDEYHLARLLVNPPWLDALTLEQLLAEGAVEEEVLGVDRAADRIAAS